MKVKKLFPILALCLGIVLILQVSLPMVTYKIWEVVNLQGNTILISPSPQGSSLSVGVSINKLKDNFPAFTSTMTRSTPAPYPEFTISIPKLNLNKAKVYVDNNDLEKGLSHLPGAALPGERGNVFVSGHSSVVFNDNFSNLVKLRRGDKIEVLVGEAKMTYEVLGTKIVDPDNLSVISPPDPSGRYLSLMTCVPPGLNIKRLIVLTKLI